MIVEREAYEYQIADGSMFVSILTAERQSRYDFDKGREVEVLQPRVWVSTDSKFEADVELGFVKIRGRKYATEHAVKRLPDGGQLDRHGREMKWQTETSYRGGYRNDQGSAVSYEAKAYDRLRELEIETMNRFEAEHPEWQTASIRLLFERERDSRTDKAKRLRSEAKSNDHKAAEWQKRIDKLDS